MKRFKKNFSKKEIVLKKKSDSDSIVWSGLALFHLGCPDIQPCQGNKKLELKLSSDSYKRTPDMVAGPIIGNASLEDFYIDVAELQGQTIYNPKRRRGIEPPAMLKDPANNPGTISGADMPVDHFDGYISTIKKKIDKYSRERSNSPMLGICIHLDVSGITSGAKIKHNDLMRFMTRLDYQRFLDFFFSLHVYGKIIHPTLSKLWGNEIGATVLLFVPFKHRFTFLSPGLLT